MSNHQISLHDSELLSAYIDGQLNKRQRIALERRLRTNPELRSHLEGLRQIRLMLRSLPRLRAPRNFTISPQTAGIRPPSRLPAIFGAVSAFSSALLVLLMIGSVLLRDSGQPSVGSVSAPAMADDSELFSAEVQEAAITEDLSVAMGQSQIMETPMLGVPGPQIEETNGSVEPEEAESLKLPDLPTPTATLAPPTYTPILTYTPTPSFTNTSAGIEMLTTPTSSPTPTDTLTPLPSPTATLIPTATPLPSTTPTMVIPSATPMVLAVAATEPPIEPLMLESPSVLPRGELPTPETPPAASQLPTALLIGEMILMVVAMLTGLIALILVIRSRR